MLYVTGWGEWWWCVWYWLRVCNYRQVVGEKYTGIEKERGDVGEGKGSKSSRKAVGGSECLGGGWRGRRGKGGVEDIRGFHVHMMEQCILKMLDASGIWHVNDSLLVSSHRRYFAL